jgi:hypothetical protein
MNKNAICKLVFAVILTCIPCKIIKAMMVYYSDAPIDRLLSNADSYVKENPNDANGYYILGRIHYLAFANQQVVGSYKEDGTNLPDIKSDYYQNNWDNERLTIEARRLVRQELGYVSAELQRKKAEELQKQGWKPEPKLNHEERIQHAAEAIKYFQKTINMDPNNALYHLGLASLLEQYVNYITELDIKEVPEEIRNIILNKAMIIYYKA